MASKSDALYTCGDDGAGDGDTGSCGGGCGDDLDDAATVAAHAAPAASTFSRHKRQQQQQHIPCSSSSNSDTAPVLFLDVDGVLNIELVADESTTTTGSFSSLHVSLVERLARVVRGVGGGGVRVVLSSSWRHDRQRMVLLERAWRVAQLPRIVDATPTLSMAEVVVRHQAGACIVSTHRVLEIQKWLEMDATCHKREQPRRWIAIDDLDLASAGTFVGIPSSHFIQTAPQHGITSRDVDDIIDRLGIISSTEEEPVQRLPRQPLPAPALALQSVADLIVVSSSSPPATAAPTVDTSIVIIDVSDFSVVACVDTTKHSFRAWLMDQEGDFSLDRVVGIVLQDHRGQGDKKKNDDRVLSYSSCDVSVYASMSPADYAHSFVHSVRQPVYGSSTHTIELLLDAIQNKQSSSFCVDTASAELRSAGFDAPSVAVLMKERDLAGRMLEGLAILKPLSPRRVGLLAQVCRLFAGRHDQNSRRVAVEYIARDEVTTYATLQAIRQLLSLLFQQVSTGIITRTASGILFVEEIDELLAGF